MLVDYVDIVTPNRIAYSYAYLCSFRLLPMNPSLLFRRMGALIFALGAALPSVATFPLVALLLPGVSIYFAALVLILLGFAFYVGADYRTRFVSRRNLDLKPYFSARFFDDRYLRIDRDTNAAARTANVFDLKVGKDASVKSSFVEDAVERKWHPMICAHYDDMRDFLDYLDNSTQKPVISIKISFDKICEEIGMEPKKLRSAQGARKLLLVLSFLSAGYSISEAKHFLGLPAGHPDCPSEQVLLIMKSLQTF